MYVELLKPLFLCGHFGGGGDFSHTDSGEFQRRVEEIIIVAPKYPYTNKNHPCEIYSMSENRLKFICYFITIDICNMKYYL